VPDGTEQGVGTVVEGQVRPGGSAPSARRHHGFLVRNGGIVGPDLDRARRVQAHDARGRRGDRAADRGHELHVIIAVELNRPCAAGPGDGHARHGRAAAPGGEESAERPGVGDGGDRAQGDVVASMFTNRVPAVCTWANDETAPAESRAAMSNERAWRDEGSECMA
jgi:hypothetical protein